MIAAELVNNCYLVATGKLPTFSSGSAKWLKILAIANIKIGSWENEQDANWNSLYDPKYSFGTISATDTFALDDEISYISDAYGDTVRIYNIDGTTTDYDITTADQLKNNSIGNYCAQIGRNLVFNKAFISTYHEFGGKLTVPIYYYASSLKNDSDVVPVNDPQWLVLMTAAEYVRNDLLKQNQYPNLISEANAIMDSMKSINDAQVERAVTPWRPNAMNW